METPQTCQGSIVAPPATQSEIHVGQDLVDDQIARQLVHIWQQVLNVDSINLDQNYFDLGGDSSLAVQMFSRIEDTFKIKLPLATLYEAPTVGELAQILRSEGSASRWSPLVAIHPAGSRPPFFCVHPHGGNVLIYRDLSRQLGSDQPFFGLQSQGLNGTQEPLNKIEAMGDLYLSEIRRVQSHGPYFLGGYCMGGAVAYEMACQLTAEGEKVGLLALFDAMEFSSFPDPSFSQMSYYNCQRFLFHMANLFQLRSHDRSRFLLEKLRSLRVRIPVWIAGVSARLRSNRTHAAGSSETRALDRVGNANFQAYLKYDPKPYPGTVTDIRPCRQYRLFDDSRFKWDRLAQGGQETIVLPVNPPAMLSEPFVRHLAAALRQCMDGALEAHLASDNQA